MDMSSIIEQVYHEPWRHGSLQNTLEAARKTDASTTLDDVKKWKEENVAQSKQQAWYISFIAYKRGSVIFMNGLPDKNTKWGCTRLLLVHVSDASTNEKQVPIIFEYRVSPVSLTEKSRDFWSRFKSQFDSRKFHLFGCQFHWLRQLATESVKLAWP